MGAIDSSRLAKAAWLTAPSPRSASMGDGSNCRQIIARAQTTDTFPSAKVMQISGWNDGMSNKRIASEASVHAGSCSNDAIPIDLQIASAV